MLNQTGIRKVSAGMNKSILEDDKLFFSMSCKVVGTGTKANSDGNKIIKAGTPLAGDLQNRDIAFTVATSADNVVGILFNDVDVTDVADGDSVNATVIVFGFVNVDKLDESVKTALTADIQKALNITFVK
jgi:hypothetical protein